MAILYSMNLAAQSTELGLTMPPIPTIRQLSHEYIQNSEQSLIQYPSIAKDTSTIQSIRLQIFENRKWIETNTALSDNEKFKWLRGINNLLFELHAGLKTNKINTAEVVNAFRAYTGAMQLSARGLTISEVIKNENNNYKWP